MTRPLFRAPERLQRFCSTLHLYYTNIYIYPFHLYPWGTVPFDPCERPSSLERMRAPCARTRPVDTSERARSRFAANSTTGTIGWKAFPSAGRCRSTGPCPLQSAASIKGPASTPPRRHDRGNANRVPKEEAQSCPKEVPDAVQRGGGGARGRRPNRTALRVLLAAGNGVIAARSGVRSRDLASCTLAPPVCLQTRARTHIHTRTHIEGGGTLLPTTSNGH